MAEKKNTKAPIQPAVKPATEEEKKKALKQC